MRAEGWMFIWALKEGTPMDMEKKGMKTLLWKRPLRICRRMSKSIKLIMKGL
jgi:hypothetical protein